MIIVEPEELSLSLLDFGEVARPRDYIILILVVEDHLCVYEILDDLLTAAIFEEFFPCRVNWEAFDVVVGERIVVHLKGGPHVDIRACSNAEYHKADDGI